MDADAATTGINEYGKPNGTVRDDDQEHEDWIMSEIERKRD